MGDADKNRVGFSNIRGGLEPRLVRVRGGVGLTDAGPPPTPQPTSLSLPMQKKALFIR